MKDTTRVNIQLPAELHKELKLMAVNQNQTLATVIRNAIKDTIKDKSK